MIPLLVLRAQPGAAATIARAHGLGVPALAIPLFEIESVRWSAPSPSNFDGLLLTSANSVRFAGGQLQAYRALKAYAVGAATAGVARDAGFDIAATGDSGVDRLLGSLEPDLNLLHFCGEHRRQPDRARQQITPVVVYRAKAIPDVDLSHLSSCVALVHSPRAAQRLGELATARGSVVVAAISDAAARAAGSGWQSVHVPDEPTDEGLLALAASLCKNA